MTWPHVRLGDVLDTSIGGVWGKPPGEGDVEVRVWRVTELKTGGRLDSATAASRSVSVKQFESRALQAGDLLLEKSGGGPATPVGRVGLVTAVPEPAICSNFMQLLRPCTAKVEPRYLHLYLNHFHAGGGTLSFQTSSTNIRNIKASDYVSITFPLPPLDEQRRIVDLLEDHFSRLDAAENYLTSGLRRAKVWHQQLLTNTFWSADYPRARVGELLREPMRNGRSDRAATGGEAGTRSLTLTAVTKNAFTDANTKVTSTAPERARDLWLEPGDVFVQRSNTPELVGSTARYDGPREWAIFPDLLIRLRADEDRIDSRFLAAALQSRPGHDQLRRKAKGLAGSMPKIDQSAIAGTTIPLPPVDVQQEMLAVIEDAAGALKLVRAAMAAAQSRSRALRRALLEAAFAGRMTSNHQLIPDSEELAR